MASLNKQTLLSASVCSLGWNIFFHCNSLRSLNFSSGFHPQIIGEGTFLSCWSLTDILISKSVQIINLNKRAAGNCVFLAFATFESYSQLQRIEWNAFLGTTEKNSPGQSAERRPSASLTKGTVVVFK
ncbi:MAG: leucine-rich repeat domain-containing protein [Holosporales bacterium]|nr:leucine-rich repeat domain-containing protein [Holosporales bacterium]